MPGAVRTSVFVGASVDGFIARPDGSFDFLPDSPEPHGFDEFFASIDALLMGRKTYETALGFGTWPYGSKPVFVWSRRSLAAAPPGAVLERLSGSPENVLAELAARHVHHAYVDGGQTVHSFLRAGLIDRVVVTRVPVLIGSGISIFGPLERDLRLRHVMTRHFPSGLVQSEYEVVAA
jgi:dihydrofolate reductase